MTSSFLLFFAVALTFNLFLGLIRVMRGPTFVDRMIAAQLMGTTIICVLLIASRALAQPYLVDISLVFGLLDGVAAVAASRFGRSVADEVV
ncbi:monovalent cation/H+ antiporter complex subunit F [Pirellulaceae bacterium SH449]